MNIGIVGGGNAGKDIIEIIKSIDKINIKVLIDQNQSAPGFIYAKKLGIECETDIEFITDYNLETIVEVTGSEYVKNYLYEQYQDESVGIIDSKAALLVTAIVDKQKVLNNKLDNKLKTIQNVSKDFEVEFENILDSVNTINTKNDSLNQSVNVATDFVNESDELIASINKIANKNKILGLNANIEAARAGEAGRGFAVVADEVQNLSDMTTNFSDEIADSLDSLKEELQLINKEVNELKNISKNQKDYSNNLKTIISKLV
ncbi:MAG: methyl-accepting chemotaxis protein [Bacillota bacterium]